MRLALLLISFLFLHSSAQATKKVKIDAVFFEKVPRLPNGGGPLAMVSLEVAKKIEAARKDILKNQNIIVERDNITVISLADDLGMLYLILVFSGDGKLQAGVSDYQKYGQCFEWSIQKAIVKTTCSGSEGGESWRYDITYDFKKMLGKVDQKK